jgi:hypothetical protein
VPAPGPPWTLEATGVAWVHRGAVGALVRYASSPVGPYSEVWGAPAASVRGGRVAITVPFIAVDSAASLEGGRANWALPKTRATFGDGTAEGPDWCIRARVVSAGVRIPVLVIGLLDQPGDVRSPFRAYGRGRLARVEVETAGVTPRWLASGRHPGIVLDGTKVTVGAPYR